MKATPPQTWTLDADSLWKEIKLHPEDRRLVKARSSDLIDAIAQTYPDARRETADMTTPMSAGAPLYVRGIKLHLNLAQAAKEAVVGALSLIVQGIVMSQKDLIALSQPLSASTLTALFAAFTTLTNEQRSILDGICMLKRQSKFPGYAPTTKDLAKALQLTPISIEKNLKPIMGKVVTFNAEAKTWKILF